MVNVVAIIFAEVLGVPLESITDATSPDTEPRWDSLKVMPLALALEAAFSVRFTTREILAMRTVGLVRKVLREKGVQDG